MKTRVLAAITLLTFLMIIPLATPAAQASSGVPVTDPSNLWYPYGPYPYSGTNGVQKILFRFYNGPDFELRDFELGHLDLPDSEPTGVPSSSWGSYTANPAFVLSPVQGQFGVFGIFFNMMSNRFKAWGCDWANGNSQCGIDMREAFAHLIDRQSVVTDGPLNGAGQAIADPSPPAKIPAGSPLSVQCSWDSLPQYHNNCNFAFHTGPPCPGGFCTDPSQPDFCAAVSYMIQANADSGGALGLSRDASAPMDAYGNHCGIDPNSPGLANIAAHGMLTVTRNNDPRRLYLYYGFLNAVNTLFTRPVAIPCYSIGCSRIFIYHDGLLGGAALWDSYTYGYGESGPFPDQMYSLYNSVFSSNFCGGRQLINPQNPTFDCVASLDADSLTAQNSGDVATFQAAVLRAFNDFGSHALDIPVFTPGVRTVALKSVVGLTNQLGFGYNNLYSLLSAHSDGITTGTFAFGGGNPSILRYGQSGDTNELNVFNAQTVWETQLISEIYDPLFAGNPVNPGQIFCWMCDNYNQLVDASGNTHFDVELRQGLRWQDGQTVTARDVAFSLFNERDSSADFGSALSGLLLNQTSVLSNTRIDIVMSGVSVDWLPIISGAPIIPSHVWELTSGPGSAGTSQAYSPDHSIGIVDPAKLSLDYDPMTAHTLVGSGPFACVDLSTGVVGGGCALTAAGTPSGQAILADGTALLTRYDFSKTSGDPFNQWMRTYNSDWGSTATLHSGQFQEFRWADRFNNDTVTIRDFAQAATCFGASAPTAACPASDSVGLVFAHWQKTSFDAGGVLGPEVALVQSHFDDAWVDPFSWSKDQGAQPGQTLDNITPWT